MVPNRAIFGWLGGMIMATVATGLGGMACQGEVSLRLRVRPEKVISRVDEKIYSHFLEHIYHSVHGGLWGEMIWNRSFEELMPGVGAWRIEGDELIQEATEAGVRLVFGDPNWTDYEFSLEAQKISGREGFLVLFRVKGLRDFYWLNVGGWSNTAAAVERSIDNRRKVVSPWRPFRVEEGRWYKIRVLCQGRRIRVWVDDDLLLDFTDDEDAHLGGQVGVGTWSTRAKFRNLKVTSLDGTILFEGLPEPPKHITARHWQAFGKGEVRVTSENPLNSDQCQFISSTEGETGLRQSPLYIHAGEIYRGSVWVRGEAPNGLVVRLKNGEEVIAEQKLPSPTSEWREYPIEFKPRETAESATFEIAALAPARVWIDQVSLMSESSLKVGGFRPDLLEALKALRPAAIRWPGGCFASAYRWKDGIGPQHKRRVYPRHIWDDLEVNAFGTDEFIRLCRAVGAEPIIVINIGTRGWNGPEAKEEEFLQDAVDWVEYCNGPPTSRWGSIRAANGHPEPYDVKFWEIDNETWHMGPEAYAEAIRRFVPALKKVDPDIKIIACGSGGYDWGALRWNRIIIEQCAELIDYLSIHHYENPDKFAEGPYYYERFFREVGKIIANSRNPNIKLFVSEWNAQSIDWRTGLYAGGLLNAFERCSDIVEIASPALLMRHWWSGVGPWGGREWDNAFINFDHRSWFPAPNYVVMKLWRDHYAPFLIEMEGETKPLNAVATKSADGKSLHFKAVNPTEQEVRVELAIDGKKTVKNASMQVVAPGNLFAVNTLEEPNRVSPKPTEVQTTPRTVRFTLPPYSVGVVAISLE